LETNFRSWRIFDFGVATGSLVPTNYFKQVVRAVAGSEMDVADGGAYRADFAAAPDHCRGVLLF